MERKSRHKRRAGSLGALRRSVWVTIEYLLRVVEDEALEHELRQKSANGLVQAAIAYSRLVELHEIEGKMKVLEALSMTNGHHP